MLSNKWRWMCRTWSLALLLFIEVRYSMKKPYSAQINKLYDIARSEIDQYNLSGIQKNYAISSPVAFRYDRDASSFLPGIKSENFLSRPLAINCWALCHGLCHFSWHVQLSERWTAQSLRRPGCSSSAPETDTFPLSLPSLTSATWRRCHPSFSS